MADDILERRKQLLRQRLGEQAITAAEPAPPARRGTDPSPLSDAQRRMWFVQRLDPDDTTLNICVAYRLSGELDATRLRAAFATLVARHEILRTTYHIDDTGEPYQVSRVGAELAWQDHDLTELPESGRERRVEVLARREFARPFDLTQDSPLRASLVRTGDAGHVLILTVHHIAWDDDSWPVFFAEVNAAYRDTDLPELTVQYADIAAARTRAAETDAADLDYWRGVLTPLPSRLELPGRSPSAGYSRNAETRVRSLPGDLMERVGAVGRDYSATPFMVLLAGFQALIRRYTAATDFLISVPVTNRSGRGAAARLGYLGNNVMIRATSERDANFAQLLESTVTTATGAFAHQGLGIEQVVRAVGPDRVAGRDGLAQIVQLSFGMRGAVNGFDLPGVRAAELPLASAVAQEELGLMIVADDSGTRVEATYLVDALDQRTVDQLLDHYVQLLGSVLDTPERRLSEIDILGADRAAVLAASHGPLAASEPTTMVAQLEERVAATPAALAVVSDEIELTYAELNARANRLAYWLLAEGVGPEDIVAVGLATSVDFVVAVWAILKSGAAYLPIDPGYPAERIDYLIDDARPRIRFTESSYAAAVAAAATLPATNPADTDRKAPLRPGNIAYVIYTSGSTGQPKGVPVPHAAIADHLASFAAEWDLTPADRVLQSTSVSFDASLMDIFVTQYVGGCVVIPKPNAYRDIPYVADLVTRHGVSVLHMVPSMLATFLLLPEINDWTTLRHMPVGGEALPGEVADRFTARFDAQLRNHYGPTEAVVCSTHMPVEGPHGTGIVPIGRPNRNVHLYLLDDALQLVPNGVVGEIYLGGDQLARGYLHRAGLSAERFVADPFRAGQRLYRTGDLGRRGPDGMIEFIGRTDEQVKVRGHRIELGEVEAAISNHPDVAHAVVVVTEHPSLGQILAAYPVPVPGAELDLDALRARVAARLPEYMIPAAYTVIDRIPLTTHGKLDRRALPVPELAVTGEFRAPRTPTERRIAELYGRLFDRAEIGADDSFFALGGHSLLAARLISMIRAEFGLELDMRVPFDTPTVSGLAAYIGAKFLKEFGIDIDDMAGFDEADGDSAAAGAAGPAPRPALVRRDHPERIPLNYSQRMYWLQRRMEGAIDGENVTYPVRFDGPLDIDALRAAITDVATRHDSLRTTFPEHEGTPYQHIAPPAPVPMPVVDLREGGADPAELLERELAADAAYVFDLATEIQLRVRLLVLDERTHVLSILMHHIIADRQSCEIFVDDLTTAYRARLHGTAPDWPELEIQFADFAIWQREIFDRAPGHGAVSAYGQELLDYWCTALDGMPDEIAVAHDHPRPAVLARHGVSATRRLPAATWLGARQQAEAAGTTEFMLCQAMSAVTLHALGAGNDLPIGAAVANRLDEQTDRMIGLFANMVVLRNDLSGEPTPREVLSRVRDAALDAITRQGVPFDRLVETINPPRTLSRNPLFQVVMHFRNRPPAAAFTADGTTTVTGIAKQYEVSFMDIHFDYTVETDGDLTTRVVVNTDLYEPETGAVFADVLARVVECFATQPDRPVRELRVLPDGWDTGRVVVRHEDPIEPAVLGGGTLLTETERTIATLLAELLEIDEVGREDGFFALGGDSVIAIQLATRAGEAGLPLAPQLLFEYFTIADLAAAVDELIANPPGPEGESAAGAQQHLAPMAASGLDADTLKNLQNAWSAQG
ncbi:non-ribosomal peptide synthetase [Nocardia carnea]|uniref:non-ribosomal peptide synthetase n=1 Tax=Nocardia carnea TaxID=37328 RepID=UPI002453A43E|nr:non-ribosomal peptide synthetase [Nocardia carnea]